jgi:hypothetical protein
VFPVRPIGVREFGPGHNLFCGKTSAPVAVYAENHGNAQGWLYRSDVQATGGYRGYRGHSTGFPVFPDGVPGLGHNFFYGRTPAPVAAHAENHGNTQCWLYRSDVTLFISVQLLNLAIDGPRCHVCWPEIMRWVPVPSATDCKKHALVEPYCTSCRMHSSTVLPKDNADDIS